MDLFKTAGTNRGTNDMNNKAREAILAGLCRSEDPSLQDLKTAWKRALNTLCSDYDDVLVKQKGGRGANYDFMITFLQKGAAIRTVPCEFKHNSSRIDTLPEYFSPAADKPYLSESYAAFFYDRYLDRICEVYPDIEQHKPEKDTYLRLVHNDGYDRHPFFHALYTAEVGGTREDYKKKQTIVRESIQTFLTEFSSTLNLALLSKDIQDRQHGKVFLLWDLKEFKTDTLREDEMEITHIEGIKNGNTLVVVSKAGTKHNMLLRWKNHLGVLYPAWQISLTR